MEQVQRQGQEPEPTPVMPMMKPFVGWPVQFLKAGKAFAAIVTAVWSDTCVNLLVFPDGRNSDADYPKEVDAGKGNGVAAFPAWETSINYSATGEGQEKAWRHLQDAQERAVQEPIEPIAPPPTTAPPSSAGIDGDPYIPQD